MSRLPIIRSLAEIGRIHSSNKSKLECFAAQAVNWVCVTKRLAFGEKNVLWFDVRCVIDRNCMLKTTNRQNKSQLPLKVEVWNRILMVQCFYLVLSFLQI